MKKGIHPKYYEKASIKCACGVIYETGSTVEKMTTEICSACHPFYTGKNKLVDSTGRVDRFKRMMEKRKELLNTQIKKSNKKEGSKKSEK